MTLTPLERPITVTFESKELFATVMMALDMFADFIEGKGNIETAIAVREFIGQGTSQWDCGNPDCEDCHPTVSGDPALLRLLRITPKGEA